MTEILSGADAGYGNWERRSSPVEKKLETE
jgi:hypothetical protein